MLKRAPGIFEVGLHSSQKSINEIRIFLIPGEDGERSLMADASFRSRTCLHVMEEALGKLGVTYDRLDVFLTHKHHDHYDLASEYATRGARLFMNPQENRHCYGCLCCNHNHGSPENQPQMLQSIGVTEEGASKIWNMFMEVDQRIRENRGWEFEIPGYPYTPVNEGQILNYGDYDLGTVGLKGHAYGQVGLYDRNHKVLFCADQVIDSIMPIVGTTYPDEHLLERYFDSLERLRHRCGDYLILPAHKGLIRDVKRVVDRIVFAYLDKTDLIGRILDHGHHRMTTKEVACPAYGIDHVPRDQSELIKLRMVISKTFSCLEHLYDEDFAIRTLEDRSYYWEAPQGKTP